MNKNEVMRVSEDPSRTPEPCIIQVSSWPPRPDIFPELMTPVEAAQYLRLDETGHSPKSAVRTLRYWRDHDQLKATKFARRVWFRKSELDEFIERKSER